MVCLPWVISFLLAVCTGLMYINSRRPLCVHSQGHHGQDQWVLRWQISPNCVKRVGPIINIIENFFQANANFPIKSQNCSAIRVTSTEKLRSAGAGVHFVLGCFSFKAPSFTYLAAHADTTQPRLGKLLDYSHDEINHGYSGLNRTITFWEKQPPRF